MSIERIGEVKLTIKCNNCKALNELIISNKEWELLTEMIETINDYIPAINITCPKCKYKYLMNLF